VSCAYIRTMVICVHTVSLDLLCVLRLALLPFETFDRPREIDGAVEEDMLPI